MSTPTPRLLVVSAGSIGRRHLRVARELLPGAEIAVLRRPETAEDPAPEGADHQFGEMAAALDFAPQIAIVASPAPFRIAAAAALYANGAHLLLEKPLAADPAAARDFVAVASGSGQGPIVRVGYNLRFAPLLAAARAALTEGKIGTPCLARFEVGQYLPDWRPGADYRIGVSAQSALGGGALLELSHEIDLALWMLGPPKTIAASVGRVGRLAIDVEDHATIVMDRPGLSTALHLDFLQRVPRRRLMVVGDAATLEVDMIAQSGVLRRPSGDNPLAAVKPSSGDNAYLRQLDAFCAAALPGYSPRYGAAPLGAGLAEAMAALEIVETARQSAQQGRRLRFEPGSFATWPRADPI